MCAPAPVLSPSNILPQLPAHRAFIPTRKNAARAKKCYLNFVLSFVFKIAGLKLRNFKLRPPGEDVGRVVSVLIRAPCTVAEL